MISASVAEAHRFGRVRRNGYDPVEVDAVVARLAETLRSYETKTAALEIRLAEADASADAIRRTFIAAETTRDEIVAAANEKADSITGSARNEADGIVSAARSSAADLIASAESEAAAMAELADRLDHEIARRRDEILSSAHEEAEKVLAEAEWSAAQQKMAAAQEADRLIDEATAETAHMRNAALLSHGYTTTAVARLSAEALRTADAIVNGARDRASGLVSSATEDSMMLNQKATALRDAVAELQRSAGELAALTSEEAAVLDLSQIEAMESGSGQDIDVDDSADETAHVDEPAEDIEPELRPVLSLTETDLVGSDDDEGERPDEPDNRTYYQRTTGIPLSERIKIARKSG